LPVRHAAHAFGMLNDIRIARWSRLR